MMRIVLGVLAISFALSLWVVLPPFSDWRIPGTAPAGDAVQVTRNADVAEPGDDTGSAPFITTDGTTLEAATDHLLQALGIIPEVADSGLSPFEALVVDLMKAGMEDAEIDAAVNDAALRGDITVPAELVSAEGRVDTLRLLQSVDAGARAAMAE